MKSSGRRAGSLWNWQTIAAGFVSFLLRPPGRAYKSCQEVSPGNVPVPLAWIVKVPNAMSNTTKESVVRHRSTSENAATHSIVPHIRFIPICRIESQEDFGAIAILDGGSGVTNAYGLNVRWERYIARIPTPVVVAERRDAVRIYPWPVVVIINGVDTVIVMFFPRKKFVFTPKDEELVTDDDELRLNTRHNASACDINNPLSALFDINGEHLVGNYPLVFPSDESSSGEKKDGLNALVRNFHLIHGHSSSEARRKLSFFFARAYLRLKLYLFLYKIIPVSELDILGVNRSLSNSERVVFAVKFFQVLVLRVQAKISDLDSFPSVASSSSKVLKYTMPSS
ncbi:hypothetical protein B0H19DRAFT_1098426 [Mycena capillaripes]|nr:hypothetical protein B0H19DRAFT_1098426 [Mycena capillaripes]